MIDFSLFVKHSLTFSIVLIYSIQARSQSLALNEIMIRNTQYAASDGIAYPWIELVNTSGDSLMFSDYYLSTDSSDLQKWKLPILTMRKDSVVLLWLSGIAQPGHTEFTIDGNADYLLLVSSSNQIVDAVAISSLPPDESYGRRPGAFDQWIFFPNENYISPGQINRDTGHWTKIQANAEFQAGDAGYFGYVSHDDKMWILDYETMDSSGVWRGLPEVWNSLDGLKWTKINAEPPYQHGSMVTSFDGYLWAMDSRVFRSRDGLYWEQVGTLPMSTDGSRLATYRNHLLIYDGTSIYTSTDGFNWERSVDRVPWSSRVAPAFLEHEDKLWFIGGNINYQTSYDYYYQDVWSSVDGINWELVTDSAPWPGTYWNTCVSYDGMMWMMGGWNYYQRNDKYDGNSNAIWCSRDGLDWQQVNFEHVWSPRHAAMMWVHDKSIILSGGYGGGGPHHLYNDVWRFTKETLGNQNNEIVLTYGDTLSVLTARQGDLPISYSLSDSTLIISDSEGLVAAHSGVTVVHASLKDSPYFFSNEWDISVNIKKKSLVAKPGNIVKAYGMDVETEIQYSGFVFGEGKEAIAREPVPVNINSRTPVGKYPLQLGGGGADNYEFIYEEGTIEIIKKKLVARPIGADVEYGSPYPDFLISYQGFVPGEGVDELTTSPLLDSIPLGQTVGTYALILRGGEATNYEIQCLSDTLRIIKKILFVKAVDIAITYGSSPTGFQIEYFGFIDGESDSVLTTVPFIEAPINARAAGTYDLHLVGGAAMNYELHYLDGTLTISKKELIVKAPDINVEFGSPLNIDLEYSGFIDGEDVSSLVRPPFVQISGALKAVGAYVLLPEGGVSRNYDFTYLPGILNIRSTNSPLHVYPNPCTDQLQVVMEQIPTASVHIAIYEATGRLVLTSEVGMQQMFSINTTGLSPGLYVLEVVPIDGKRLVSRVTVL